LSGTPSPPPDPIPVGARWCWLRPPNSGLCGERRAAAIEAISCAEAAGASADAALHRALINLVAIKVVAAEGLDAELLDRAAGLEARLPRLQLYDTADLHYGLWSRFVEDLDTARAALQRSIVRAREAGDDLVLCTFSSYLAATEELAGDYAAAAAAVGAAADVAAWHDWPPSPWVLGPRCELLIRDGDLDAVLRVADKHLADDDSVPPVTRYWGAYLRGKVSAWRGDPEATVRRLERAAEYAAQLEWADPAVRNHQDMLLAEAYVAVGRGEDARHISAWLAALGERLSRPALTGGAHRIDALLAAEAGDLATAADAARAAVAAHEASPLRPELARSLLILGRIERRRKARRQSRDALQWAHALATGMGHLPLLAEIERELPRVAAERSGTELTATERRVADLIAAGATNRDAAAALFVSVRTIETHVAAIYRKLGVRTRAELARRYQPKAQ